MNEELKGIVICLKCGARGVRKYIFAQNLTVKCPCGNELKAYDTIMKNKGIDWSKESIYDAIGRPDLAPTKKENFVAFTGMDLSTMKSYLQDIIGSWNGEDERFMHEGEIFHEDNVGCAEEIIEKIDELQTLLNDF